LYKQIYATNGTPIEGLYADLNRDGAITSADQTVYKNPIPKVILGFSSQATYKKWTISTVLRANIGNYDYNVVDANMAIAGNALNKGFLQNVPTAYFKTQFLNNEFLSNYYVENASFLKMDNLGLAYYVGKVINNQATLRISANCQNVFTVTKYTGMDPEVYGGLDNNIYPRPRTYTLSLNLTY
jgi:iron complex outermembrane receptor protein